VKNFAKFLGIIAITVIIGFSMSACDDGSGGGGDGGGVNLPQNSGTNEVIGKTLYLSDWRKIVFASTGTTFKGYYDDDELDNEGAYSYNSENKTITLAIEYVYWDGTKMNKTQAKSAAGKEFDEEVAWLRANFDTQVLRMAARELPVWDSYWDDYYDAGEPDDEDAFLKQWLTQKGYNSVALISQWKSENPTMNTADKYINAIVAEEGYKNLAEMKADYISWVDEEFAPITYDYQFTTDNAFLVQEKLPANKGSNELSGKTFDYDDGYAEYTFTTNGYSRKSTYNDQITVSGTYAYDSTAKRVWLRPEKVYGSSSLQTMSEYYASSAYGNTTASKAAETNSRFRVDWERYGLTPINWIGYYYDDNRYSVSLSRSVADTLEIKNSGLKTLRQIRQKRLLSSQK
jgi:hypothetical protein